MWILEGHHEITRFETRAPLLTTTMHVRGSLSEKRDISLLQLHDLIEGCEVLSADSSTLFGRPRFGRQTHVCSQRDQGINDQKLERQFKTPGQQNRPSQAHAPPPRLTVARNQRKSDLKIPP